VRKDGQRIANWDVDITILLNFSTKMTDIHVENLSRSSIILCNKMFPHLERSLNILRPWMVAIDSDARNHGLHFGQTDYLLGMSSQTERSIALVAMNRNHFDVAEGHCLRGLANAKRLGVEGENKTTLISRALNVYVELRHYDTDKEISQVVTFAEEAYNVVVIAYDCVHPQVQEAAGILINCLVQKGELFNAERFAQQTYENLRDRKNGINQEGVKVAMGSYTLANVIYLQKGDLLKAEKLAREALRIRFLVYSRDDHRIGI
jgi:G3E family GTPase